MPRDRNGTPFVCLLSGDKRSPFSVVAFPVLGKWCKPALERQKFAEKNLEVVQTRIGTPFLKWCKIFQKRNGKDAKC